MTYTRVLPNIPAPEPVTQVRIRRVDATLKIIKFFATQAAIREIERHGFGILLQARSSKSGWCVLVVNDVFEFEAVALWMYAIAGPDEGDLAEAI